MTGTTGTTGTAQPQVESSGSRILVVDDEPEIRRIVEARLAGEGFVVEGAATAAAGVDLVARWRPDVVLLDLTLPDRDGIAVCRELRGWSTVPIIVLSARMDEKDKVAALEAGADDYLTKPFFPRELVARIRVALRHAAQTTASHDREAVFQTGSLTLDFARRRKPVLRLNNQLIFPGLVTEVRDVFAIR